MSKLAALAHPRGVDIITFSGLDKNRRDVPDFDIAVGTAGGERRTPRVERDSVDRPRVLREAGDLLARGRVPKFDGAIVACRGQPVSIGTDRDRRDGTGSAR